MTVTIENEAKLLTCIYKVLCTIGAYKVDQKYHPPAINVVTKLAKSALSNATAVRIHAITLFF